MSTKEDIELINRAREAAKTAHVKHVRHRTGDPYFEGHVEQVAYMVQNAAPVNIHLGMMSGVQNISALVAAAYLHDVVEDCENLGWTHEVIERDFGPQISEIVKALTRDEKDSYYTYIHKIALAGPYVALIKVCDLVQNIGDDLGEGSMKDKYRFARDFLVREYNFEGIDLNG